MENVVVVALGPGNPAMSTPEPPPGHVNNVEIGLRPTTNMGPDYENVQNEIPGNNKNRTMS
jgi:hypothetical protein